VHSSTGLFVSRGCSSRLTELGLAELLIEVREAGDVGGQQVGRELDAAERAVDRARERPRQRGLAGAGHVLQQHVALAQQRDQQQIDDRRLADDHAPDIDTYVVGSLLGGNDVTGDGHSDPPHVRNKKASTAGMYPSVEAISQIVAVCRELHRGLDLGAL